jgi:hypothetical protein
MIKKIVLFLTLVLTVLFGKANTRFEIKSTLISDSSYKAADIKNLALALTAKRYKAQGNAIAAIQDFDIKNLAIAKTATSFTTQGQSIDKIKNPDIKNLAIAITAISYKTQEQAINAIGMK